MEKCKRCGSEKFYLLPRKEGENINDAAMVFPARLLKEVRKYENIVKGERR